MIADVEPDRKGVPVLLRQYLRLGGRIVAFTIDREFNNTLDALVIVDLRLTETSLLERYMGQAGAQTFRAYHALSAMARDRNASSPRPGILESGRSALETA